MNKKIIAIAVLLLCLVVVLAACKKEPEYKVDFTVELDNGEIVEVYEDEDGENFVTNVDGDEIPVTTDVDGFYDDIKDLVTATTNPDAEKTTNKTTTSTTEKQTSTTTTKAPDNDDETSTEKPTDNNTEEPTESTTESTTKQEVQLGSGSSDSSIDWDDIVDIGGN